VVGSTSCGKSSLLQAITKLPFPVDSGICTLFATETKIHRCKPSERPYYTITMEGRTQSSLLTPREYYGDSWLDVSQHLQEDLKDAFDSVSPKSTDKGDENAVGHSAIQRMRRIRQRVQLTEDVMRVDVYKPDQAHFSVVDIPGLVSGNNTLILELWLLFC
jgi:ABC-type glutathione transport system ATPase component